MIIHGSVMAQHRQSCHVHAQVQLGTANIVRFNWITGSTSQFPLKCKMTCSEESYTQNGSGLCCRACWRVDIVPVTWHSPILSGPWLAPDNQWTRYAVHLYYYTATFILSATNMRQYHHVEQHKSTIYHFSLGLDLVARKHAKLSMFGIVVF